MTRGIAQSYIVKALTTHQKQSNNNKIKCKKRNDMNKQTDGSGGVRVKHAVLPPILPADKDCNTGVPERHLQLWDLEEEEGGRRKK